MRIFGQHMHESEHPWDGAPPWAIELGLIGLRILARMEPQMAAKQTLDDLVKATTANTNATRAAKDALDGYVKSTSELTDKLKAALEGDDDAAVKAAVSAIEENTAALGAATPQVAKAITDNTPAAGQPAG